MAKGATAKEKKGRPSKKSLAAKQEGKNRIQKYKDRNCYTVFSRKKSLDVHERTHTGFLPIMAKESTTKVKKGRPSRESLAARQEEGKNDMTAKHPCLICYVGFELKKGLIAHMRTHTGEKPYECTYPGCTKKCAQSGQLRTHQYRHTGEEPFACPATGCTVRYKHSNRFCPLHPSLKLKRDGNHKVRSDLEHLSPEERNWFKIYKEKISAKTTKVCNPGTSSEARNPKRKRSIKSERLDEESFGKEQFPVKSSSPVPMNNDDTSEFGSGNIETSSEVRNPKRKRSIKSERLDGESFDKETFQVKSSSPVPMKNDKTSGYGSLSISNRSSSPGHHERPEEMNVDSDPVAQPPEERDPVAQSPERMNINEAAMEAALILLSFRNSM